MLTVLSPDGHVLQSNTYDADGRLLQRLDGVGSGVKYEYDLADAQRRIVSMGGASQELEYDAQGRITGIVDGNGSETKYLLDEWGRITGVVKTDGSTERYAYNFAGDMVSSTDGEGHTTGTEDDEGRKGMMFKRTAATAPSSSMTPRAACSRCSARMSLLPG